MAITLILEPHSWPEVNYYLLATPCPACGKGPMQAAAAQGESRALYNLTCPECGRAAPIEIQCDSAEAPPEHLPYEAPAATPINPDPQPSRIIDVGQWLSLFYLLIESASKAEDRVISRRLGYQASQCLAEALKFYGEDELPPEKALFTESSRNAFHDHPEAFARQRLRDMQAKLPSPAVMARQVERDLRAATPGSRKTAGSWWKFWQRRK